MIKLLALSVSMVLALPILSSAAGSVGAGTDLAATPSLQQGPTDPTELESFLDQLLRQQMEENHIAGAAVSVVQDGDLLLVKGYGSSDLSCSHRSGHSNGAAQ